MAGFFGSFFNGLLSTMLSNDDGTTSEARQARYEENTQNGVLDAGTNDYFGNLLRKWTGASLTDAEKDANAFNAEQANIAFQRNLFADNTKYTRAVLDMQNAGLNPMLAAGNAGGSSVSSPSASSVSPGSGDISSIFQFIMGMKQYNLQKSLVKAQIEDIKASAANKVADTALKESQTEKTGVETQFLMDSAQARLILIGSEAERNTVSAEVARRNQDMLEKNAAAYRDHLEAQDSLIAEQVTSESVRRALYRAQAREANQSASYQAAMFDVEKRYIEAKTDSERENYELLAIEARIKNGIYTEQYIKDICRAAHEDALAKQISNEYQRGNYRLASESLQKVFRKLEHEGTVRSNVTVFNTTEHGASAAEALPYR